MLSGLVLSIVSETGLFFGNFFVAAKKSLKKVIEIANASETRRQECHVSYFAFVGVEDKSVLKNLGL